MGFPRALFSSFYRSFSLMRNRRLAAPNAQHFDDAKRVNEPKNQGQNEWPTAHGARRFHFHPKRHTLIPKPSWRTGIRHPLHRQRTISPVVASRHREQSERLPLGIAPASLRVIARNEAIQKKGLYGLQGLQKGTIQDALVISILYNKNCNTIF